MLAYAARYGNQPLPVLLGMTRVQLVRFILALREIVRRENGDDG